MKPTDPRRGDPNEISLRATFRAQEIQRQARYDQLEARLQDHSRRIDALLAEERQAERDRVAAEVAAALAEEQADALPAIPPEPIEGHVPDPAAEDLDQLAASSAMGSPAHLEWRRQHSSPGRGIFGGGI